MKTLRKGERCPIHNSFWCCGRQKGFRNKNAPRASSVDVRRVEDEFHPRGFREICSSRELRRRKLKLLHASQECFYCGEKFEDFRDVVLAHKTPKGMGGCTHDDSLDNLAVSHSRCNLVNGSRRVA